MKRQEILDDLKAIFDRVTDGRVDTSTLSEDSEIIDQLGLDSLDLLEMRFDLEGKWNVVPTDEEAMRLKTVGDVVDLVLERGA